MAKDFIVVGSEELRTVRCTKAAGVTIEAGDLVTQESGLIVKAEANDAIIAYAPNGAASADLTCDVTVGNDFILEGTGEQVFAVTQKGAEVDIVGTAPVLINNDASSTDVLKIDISENAGTVSSTAKIRVRINKPLF